MKKLSEVKRSPVDELSQFRQGYTTCVQEATQFLVSLPGLDLRVGHRLVSHLMAGPPPPPPPPPPPTPPITNFNAFFISIVEINVYFLSMKSMRIKCIDFRDNNNCLFLP